MLRQAIVVACCCLYQVQATVKDNPKIVIIGSGAAGIAAGTRLLENGFTNITILEAENRIGGRVYTTQFGGYSVDLGGQWVAGEENNAVFEMVWPLGLLEKSSRTPFVQTFSSSGYKMPEATANKLYEFLINTAEMEVPEEYKNRTIGDLFTRKFAEYFETHPDIKLEDRGPLLNMLQLMQLAQDASDSWFNVTLDSDQIDCKGDQLINWKDRGYGTIIDILLKKFPNSAEELPFVNKTVLNAQVSQIKYNNSDGMVRVTTENRDEYLADHVIFTPSLGVLKADHEKLFDPPLPEAKVNAIKGFQLGSVAKIYLFFPEPWWPKTDEFFAFNFYWTDDDRKAFAKDPQKSWLLGAHSVIGVEHKAKLLCVWVVGPQAREMETLPEEKVLSDIKEYLHRFLGSHYNLTEPTEMLRSQWYTNKHFRGTYSYRSPETARLGAIPSDLAEPIIEQNKLRVLFAGEATSLHQPGMVHGAIGTGWREADRLINLYADRKTAMEGSR